jgi:hypothetical protein
MDTGRRWQDWVNLILGVWLFFSPFVLIYSTGVDGAAAWNSYIIGIGVVVFAVSALARPAQWEEWINFAFGVWLLISPWVLLFSDDQAATWNHVVIGLLVGADALWAMNQADRRVRG